MQNGWDMVGVWWFLTSQRTQKTAKYKKKYPQTYCTSRRRCSCWSQEHISCWEFCSRTPGRRPLEKGKQQFCKKDVFGSIHEVITFEVRSSDYLKRKTSDDLVFHMQWLIHWHSPQQQKLVRTNEVFPKHILSNVLKQRGEDRKQSKGGVVDDLSDTSWLLPAVSELAKLQVFLSLLQIFCCTVEVGPQCCLHWLQTSLHHCPGIKREWAFPVLSWQVRASEQNNPGMIHRINKRQSLVSNLQESSLFSKYKKGNVQIKKAKLKSSQLDNCFTDCSLKCIIKHMDPNTPYPNVLTETEYVKSKFSFVTIQFCDLLDPITEYISYLNSYFSQQKSPI